MKLRLRRRLGCGCCNGARASGSGTLRGSMGRHLMHRNNQGNSGRWSSATVGVGRRGVEVDAVACLQRVGMFPVTNLQIALKKVEELIAGMDVGPHLRPFFHGDELSEVRVELSIGNHVSEALEVISRIIDARLGHANALAAAMDAKKRMWLGFEEVGEITAEGDRDASEIAQGGNDASGFELRQETGGQTGVAAEFDQSHGSLEAEAPDSLADAFFRDESFGGMRRGRHRVEVGRGGFELPFHGLTRLSCRIEAKGETNRMFPESQEVLMM